MSFRPWVRAIPIATLLALAPLHPSAVLAQMQTTGINNGIGGETVVATVDLDVRLKDPDGKPVQGTAVVTLTKLSGELFRQEHTNTGRIVFTFVPPTEYNVQVVAQSYQRTAKLIDAQGGKSTHEVNIELRPLSAEDIAFAAKVSALKPDRKS